MNYELVVKNIRHELKDYIVNNNIKSLILGVSGGIDSALVAALAKPVCDELKIPLIGRSLPMSTNKQDEIDRAHLTGTAFCTHFKQDNLGEIFNMLNILNPHPSTTHNPSDKNLDLSKEQNEKNYRIRSGNIKARLRMIYLYNLASINNGLVLSTDNYTEYMLGFSTIMGDWGDFGMIQYLWKTEVYEMAEWIAKNEYRDNKIIEHIITITINALATDGLGVTDQGDLGQIYPNWTGTSRDGYKEVDKILQIWLHRDELENKQREIIETQLKYNEIILRHKATHFKRNWPVTIKRDRILDII